MEHSRGLSRYYVLTNANGNIDEYNKTPTPTANQQNYYHFVHYIVPSVPESTRVRQQVNKRSIDDDVKEFFAIKNLAHFQYEIESKKNFYGKGPFGGNISNIDKSFESHLGNEESSIRQVFGKRMNRKSGLGIAIPNPNDPNVVEFAGESP